VAGADPPAQHDVTDGGQRRDLRYRSLGANAERIALGVFQRIVAINGQYTDASVHSVSRYDAKHVAAPSNLTQYFAGSTIFGTDHLHPAA
jgi:hypothetical protein